MRFFPIIQRELRAKSHHPMTWWRRVGATTLALVVFCFFFLVSHGWGTPSRMGRELFEILAGFAMACALLTGPLATTDCIGRERREGTLGLLFLTPLHSYDVVLGKVMVASFDMVLVATATVPVMALPFLMGGVSISEFGHFALALINLIVLSLSVGVFFSALFTSGRASLAATVLLLLGLTLGLPLLGEEVLHVHLHDKEAPFFYALCPLYTMDQVLSWGPRGAGTWKFWFNMGATHAFSWLLLLLACGRMRSIWRDPPQSRIHQWWRERWSRWRHGGAGRRLAWRRYMLDQNPFTWLEGRDRLQGRALWALLALTTLHWLLIWAANPLRWPDNDAVILWPLFAYYFLFFWIAVQAPRRLADDRQSGALELVLCTPIKTSEIVRGSMRVLWRRYGTVVMTLLVLALAGAYLHFHLPHVRPRNLWREDIFRLLLCGIVVMPIQGYTFARVGLWLGLARGNSLQATFLLIAFIGILPWVVFVMLIMGCEFLRFYFRKNMFRITDELAFTLWAVSHLIVFIPFLLIASWQLHSKFRLLASQIVSVPWWQRIFSVRAKMRSAETRS